MSKNPISKVLSDGSNFTAKLHCDTYPAIDPTKADLSGKAVLITGASRGIGLATAVSFARAGASRIAISARSSLSSVEDEIVSAAKEAGREPPEVLSFTLDVTDKQAVAVAAKRVKETWGSLDILVNNAGFLDTVSRLGENDPDEWWQSWEVNVKGTYLPTHYFLPLLLASSAKTKMVVNVSSIGAHQLLPGGSGYETTKLAVLRFTEFLQEEYKDEGLVAFAVHPGAIMTDMAKRLPKDFLGDIFKDQPRLAGNAMVWLCGAGREWLGGRYFSCTWDVEDLEKRKEEIVKGDLLKVRMAVEI